MESKYSDLGLATSEKYSILYHSLFKYPLNKKDLKRWSCSHINEKKIKELNITEKNGFFFIKGKSKDVTTRLLNEKYSIKKRKIAERASKVMSFLPTVLFVGITGSLAMNNASKNSDIDLLIVTKKDSLWLTRPVVYLLLFINKFLIRKPNTKDEKDKLCLNMWLDETNLVWDKKERNIFTAHEMAQIVPLINKHKTYEKLMILNIWVRGFWPNAVKKQVSNKKNDEKLKQKLFLKFANIFFMYIQKVYMKNKQTNEYVSIGKALFHPVNNSTYILNSLKI